MFRKILSYHQVNPTYITFCLSFGYQKHRPRDFRFSGFRSHTTFSGSSRGLEIFSRGRSGLQYQINYNLRIVESSNPPGTHDKDKVWARRQAAFHHQFDIVYGTSLWIITSGNDALKTRIQNLLPLEKDLGKYGFATPADCLKTSLIVHLEYCHWSGSQWRLYIGWLEEQIENLVSCNASYFILLIN